MEFSCQKKGILSTEVQAAKLGRGSIRRVTTTNGNINLLSMSKPKKYIPNISKYPTKWHAQNARMDAG